MDTITKKAKILLVDDSPENLNLLLGILQKDYKLFAVPRGELALQIAKQEVPDLILLDIMMPGMNGYEVCEKLKSLDITKEIPVIFITAKTNIEDEVKGFDVGGVDYITKPISFPIVLARVKAHLALKREKELLKENMLLREDIYRITQHDLRTPLNAIISIPEMINEDYDLPDEIIKDLHIIESAGLKMLNMVNFTLDLYKIETGSYNFIPGNIDIVSVLYDVINDNKSLIESKNLEIDILKDEQIISKNESFIVPGDEHLFYSVLANLIKNAIEASPQNEVITVKLKHENVFTISIHNKGAVPDDLRKTFFDKYSTSRKERGTGLGTYSAKLMVKTMKGRIQMDSSEKIGTTITITISKI